MLTRSAALRRTPLHRRTWSWEEERRFYGAIDKLNKSGIINRFEALAQHVMTKTREQVRHYFYRTVKRMNRILNPHGVNISLDDANQLIRAMHSWWELLSDIQIDGCFQISSHVKIQALKSKSANLLEMSLVSKLSRRSPPEISPLRCRSTLLLRPVDSVAAKISNLPSPFVRVVVNPQRSIGSLVRLFEAKLRPDGGTGRLTLFALDARTGIPAGNMWDETHVDVPVSAIGNSQGLKSLGVIEIGYGWLRASLSSGKLVDAAKSPADGKRMDATHNVDARPRVSRRIRPQPANPLPRGVSFPSEEIQEDINFSNVNL